MIVLLHWLHAGVIIVGVLVVVALIWPVHRRHSIAMRRQDGRVAELRAAAEEGTLVRRAEARALSQLNAPVQGPGAVGHLLVPTSAYFPLVTAAVSTLIGSAIHAGVGPEHFREGLRFGVFFVGLAIVQCVQAALLVRRPSRRLLWSVVTVELGTVALWVVTRTAGLPFGLAGKEAAGLLDVAATVVELVAAGCALAVLRIDAHARGELMSPWSAWAARSEAV